MGKCYAILWMRLEHSRILVSEGDGGPETNPKGYWGTTIIICVLTGYKQHRLAIRVVGFGFRNVEILAPPPASSGHLEEALNLLQTTTSPDCEMEVNHNYFLKLLGEVNMVMHESPSSPLPSCLGNPYSRCTHYFTNATLSRKPFLMDSTGLPAIFSHSTMNLPCINTHQNWNCSFC